MFSADVTFFVPSIVNPLISYYGAQLTRTCWGSSEFLACRSRQASIVLERYFRFEVSLLSFYACERDGPI